MQESVIWHVFFFLPTAEYAAQQTRGENVAKATIANSNSELQVAEAEAYQIGEIKQRQAKAAGKFF